MTSLNTPSAAEASQHQTLPDQGDRVQPFPAPEVYTLGSNVAERARLQQQAVDLLPHSVALLDHTTLEPGGSAIDLGCGPRGIIELLAERVRPQGRVVGLDCNADHLTLARAYANERGLTDVELVEADARHTGLPSASFDLVHARLVLINIPAPQEVAAEMARIARSGGWVCCHEADMTGLCYPPHPAWDRLLELFTTTYRAEGADPHVGRRLSHLLSDAGLMGVGIEARAEVYPIGHPRRPILLDLIRSLRPKILAYGLIGDPELTKLEAALRAHLDDPTTMVMTNLYFLAWGRKP